MVRSTCLEANAEQCTQTQTFDNDDNLELYLGKPSQYAVVAMILYKYVFSFRASAFDPSVMPIIIRILVAIAISIPGCGSSYSYKLRIETVPGAVVFVFQ